jgi:choline-glycine betaine transporter
MAMRRLAGSAIDPGVFGISLGIFMLFVVWGVFFTDNLSAVTSAMLGFVTDAFGWVFTGDHRLSGLEGLQQAAIISAAPFVLGMICLCYSLFKELRTEWLPERRVAPEPERAATRPRGVPAPQQSIALDPGSGR